MRLLGKSYVRSMRGHASHIVLSGFHMSYDRRVLKVDLQQVADRNRAVIAAGSDPGDRR